MPCRQPRSVYFEPSHLKQILRSNFRPVRRGSVLNYSASWGLPRRTRSSKSSDASNTPETQRYPLQKTVNTIHFQATDTCLFKYQRPAQMLWKTENNIFLRLYLDMRVKESEMPRVWAKLWSPWSVSQFEFVGIYCVCMWFCVSGFFGKPWCYTSQLSVLLTLIQDHHTTCLGPGWPSPRTCHSVNYKIDNRKYVKKMNSPVGCNPLSGSA